MLLASLNSISDLSPAPKLALKSTGPRPLLTSRLMSKSVPHQTSPNASWSSFSFENGSPRAVEQQVAVVVLDVGLEIAGALQALVVAAPRLVVEVGPGGDVRERLPDLLDERPVGVFDLASADRLGAVAVVFLEPDVQVDQLRELAERLRGGLALLLSVGIGTEPRA